MDPGEYAVCVVDMQGLEQRGVLMTGGSWPEAQHETWKRMNKDSRGECLGSV